MWNGKDQEKVLLMTLLFDRLLLCFVLALRSVLYCLEAALTVMKEQIFSSHPKLRLVSRSSRFTLPRGCYYTRPASEWPGHVMSERITATVSAFSGDKGAERHSHVIQVSPHVSPFCVTCVTSESVLGVDEWRVTFGTGA